MKRKVSVTATLIITLLLPSVAYSQGPRKAVEVNPVAATVNGRLITKNQVAVLVAPELRQLKVQLPQQDADFERKALAAHE